MLYVAFGDSRVQFLSTFWTYTMGECGFAISLNVSFDLFPVTLIVAYMFTVGTYGDQTT